MIIGTCPIITSIADKISATQCFLRERRREVGLELACWGRDEAWLLSCLASSPAWSRSRETKTTVWWESDSNCWVCWASQILYQTLYISNKFFQQAFMVDVIFLTSKKRLQIRKGKRLARCYLATSLLISPKPDSISWNRFSQRVMSCTFVFPK